jgi:hypothetical protein
MFMRFALAFLLSCASPAVAQNMLMGIGNPTTSPVTAVSGPSTVLNYGGTDPATSYAEGWTAALRGSVTTYPNATLTVTRQGFDGTGTAITYNKTFTVNMCLPKPYGTGQTFSSYATAVTSGTNQRPDKLCALSDYVYSTDTLPGDVTNNSTLIAPPPVCSWQMPSRTVVNASIVVEAVCFHRDAYLSGRPVAAVIFRATDGTSTNTCTASAPVVSTLLNSQAYGDAKDPQGRQLANIVYTCTLPLTTGAGGANNLASGKIAVDAKAYPPAGGTASIHDTATSPDQINWGTRLFFRSTGNFGVAYVCPASTDCKGQTSAAAGSDTVSATAGHWGITGATNGTNGWTLQDALDRPFSTLTGAIQAMAVASSTFHNDGATGALNSDLGAGAFADGLTVYVCGVVGLTAPTTTSKQKLATLTVIYDATKCNTAASLSLTVSSSPKLGSASWLTGVTESSMTYRGVPITRTSGTAALSNGNAIEYQLQDVALDFGTITTNLVSGTTIGLRVFGASFIMGSTGGASLLSSVSIRQLRGVTMPATPSTNVTIAGRSTTTSLIKNTSFTLPSGISHDNSVMAFNWQGCALAATAACDSIGNNVAMVIGAARVQNVYEWTYGSSAQNGIAWSNDGGTLNTYHIINWFNTLAAWGDGAGRSNDRYNETTGTVRRFHQFGSDIGNIFGSVQYTKHDLFYGATQGQPVESLNRTGGWSALFGVGLRGQLYRHIFAGGSPGVGGDRMKAFVDATTIVGTTDGNGGAGDNGGAANPLWMTYAGVTGTDGGTGGAGGGDYTLQSGSPCKGRVSAAPLPFDIRGTARSASGASCGAYE